MLWFSLEFSNGRSVTIGNPSEDDLRYLKILDNVRSFAMTVQFSNLHAFRKSIDCSDETSIIDYVSKIEDVALEEEVIYNKERNSSYSVAYIGLFGKNDGVRAAITYRP